MTDKLAAEAEMKRRRQEPLKEQKGCWRLRMEQPQAQHRMTWPAIQESPNDQVGHS